MTDQGAGLTRPEDTPAPLASTRWTEEQGGEEAELMPPFVPGQRAAAPVEDVPESETRVGTSEPGPAHPAPAPGVAEEVGGDADALPAEPSWGSEGGAGVDEAAPAEAPAADDFPYEAFDLSGQEMEGGSGTGAEKPADAGTGEIAERLEELARRLRADGPAAAGEALASGDRLTSLLGGVISGFLAGRSRD